MTLLLSVVVGSVIAVTFLAVAVQAFPHRGSPGMTAFLVMALLLTQIPIPSAMLWLGAIENADIVRDGLFPVYVFIEISWVVFVFGYVGRGPTMTRGRIGFLIGYGVVTSLGVILFPVLDGLVLGLVVLLNSVVQITLFAAVGYVTFLVFRAVIQYDDLPRSDAVVLLTAGGGLITLTLTQVVTPEIPADLMQGPQLAILGTVGIVVAVMQYSYGAFESGPSAGHLARESIFDEMSEAAFVTDSDQRVIDCNETAVELFGPGREQILRTPLPELLGIESADTEQDPVTLDTMAGKRQFEISKSSLTSSRETPIGTAFVLEDVTDRRTHEQRLDVLDRVLRHNLRNDLDAIQGFAEALEYQGADADVDALGSRLQDRASDLADIGETVGRAERLLARDERSGVDLVALVESLCAASRDQFRGASVQFATESEQFVVLTDRELLREALTEVIENAVQHNDRETPHVTVSIETTTDSVQIGIADDGPGIPEREREVLLDGEETPLRHGSGIGLWFVHWAMVELGGDLGLHRNQPRGTVVTLTIPAVEPSDDHPSPDGS